jgi:cytochrome c-type biogenesis protein
MSLQNTSTTRTPTRRAVGLTGLGIAVLVGLMLAGRLIGSSTPATVGSAAQPGTLLVLAVPAFLAGLLSFLSPCCLPILPTYFAFTFQARRERIVRMTVAFFLGLATTMVVLGATASALSQLLFAYLRQATLIGGIVIICFGVMSLLGKGFSGIQLLDQPAASVAGSYLYGAAFALGWTACVGPILGALLTMLATQGGAVLEGAILAFIYAADSQREFFQPDWPWLTHVEPDARTRLLAQSRRHHPASPHHRHRQWDVINRGRRVIGLGTACRVQSMGRAIIAHAARA